MFLPVNNAKTKGSLPRGCTFSENDWHILASFWHPVAFDRDVGDRPERARLLDMDLVLYRTSSGVSAAQDICPHRGTRISSGWVDGDQIVCPMHGLHFDASGACTRIPSLPNPTSNIPPRMRLRNFKCEVRYGLVWVCLKDEPIWPLPEWRGISNPDWRKVFLPKATWRAAASRHVENFNDIAHFPWVHTQSFGGATGEPVAAYDVIHTSYGLSFEVPYVEGFNRFKDGVTDPHRRVTYTYELTYPFSTLLLVDPAGSDFVHYFADTVCPVSARETLIFQVLTDTTGDPDEAYWSKDAHIINGEDRPMVEEQHPEDLPLDLTEEMHIPADRLSLEYRRALAQKFGLGAPIAS